MSLLHPDREPQAELPGIGQSPGGPRRRDRGHPLPRGGDGRHLAPALLGRQHQPAGVSAAVHAGPGRHRRPGQAGIMSRQADQSTALLSLSPPITPY